MPGEAGVWIFVLGDMTVFGLFFSIFTFYRAQNVSLFSASQLQLNTGLGAFNTCLLLTSSWLVATAVKAVRTAQMRTASGLFVAATTCGVGFAVVKMIEYGEKLRAGITLTTNDFFMYYFVFTGIHFLHLLIGIGILIFLALHARHRATGGANLVWVEAGACYWHMVDLVWILLFALIYLVK